VVVLVAVVVMMVFLKLCFTGMDAAIMVLLWPGSKPCNAPSKTAAGM